jgi:hypothetical protein
MGEKCVHRKIDRSEAEKQQIRQIRERFQRERPRPEDLLASGDATEFVSQGEYLSLLSLLAALKGRRESLGLSLADVAERTARPLVVWRTVFSLTLPSIRSTVTRRPSAPRSTSASMFPSPRATCGWRMVTFRFAFGANRSAPFQAFPRPSPFVRYRQKKPRGRPLFSP